MPEKPKRAQPTQSLRDRVRTPAVAPVPEPPPPIGETLEQFSQRPLTPAEKLGAALRVINDPEMTPEQKLRLEKHLLQLEDVPSSSAPSDDPSMSASGSATSSLEVSWTPDPPQMRVNPGDDQAFVRESCHRFLMILDQAMRDMAEMQKAIQTAEKPEAMAALVMQQQMVLYEAARTVAMQMYMIAEEPLPDLEMPEMGLIDLDGKRLRKGRKPHA